MKNNTTAFAAIGLVMAMAATPLTFAQSQVDSTAQQPTPTSADDAATPAAAPAKKVTWADLDVDKDGSLSKAEVETVPALSTVFDGADKDKDGKLTAEEYKAHAASNPK